MANMHLVTGYQGSDHVTAADHGSLYASIFGNGNYVLNRGNKFAITVVSANSVRIADGDLILQGRHIRINPGSTASLTITSGTQGYNRIDLIVARYTRNASTGIEQANLVVLKGTAVTGNASFPSTNEGNDLLSGNATTVDLPLYWIPINGITVGTPVQMFDVIGETMKDIGVKSIRKSGTIGTSWNGSSVPYTQQHYWTFVEADTIIEISLSPTATASQAEEFANLCLQDGGQSAGTFTLRCFGTKNTASIPINIVFRRD